MGPVYIDANFSMTRPPRLLRAGVREIMSRYNLPLRPVERKWTHLSNNIDNITSVNI